jgi:hypothetical protein
MGDGRVWEHDVEQQILEELMTKKTRAKLKELREIAAVLEDALKRGGHRPETFRLLRETRAEIFVLVSREAFPLSGNIFWVLGPNGKVFRCEKEKK